jgi:hypothetical protein
LKRKAREEEIKNGIQKLESTFGLLVHHEEVSIVSSSRIDSLFIEDHPGFKLLVLHEASGNVKFHKWTNPKFHGNGKNLSGFNRLKSKLGIILATATVTNKGIYVLQMDGRPKPFFYVGKAEDIERRIQQHRDGTGAFCISGEAFTRVEPIIKGSVDDMESWERNEVLARMHEFGINNVRGWMFTLKTITAEQRTSAFDQVCEKFDFCRKCGRNSHFIRDCQSLSTDLWTGGMELRTPRGAVPERKIAEAKRMLAEAARVLESL